MKAAGPVAAFARVFHHRRFILILRFLNSRKGMSKKKLSRKKPAAFYNIIPAGNFSKKTVLLLVGIMLFTFLMYSRILNHSFLFGWDDGEYVAHPSVQQLDAAGIKNYFSTFYLGMYQPIPVLSFAVNFALSGNNPTAWHVTNILLHLINVFLVFVFVRRLSGSENAALVAAALFGIHPMQTESIAWLSARSTGLFTAFYLLALISYLNYLRRDFKFSFLAKTFLFFLLALFSKSMAATLPMVLFVMDYWHGRHPAKAAIVQKLPFFALSVVIGLVSIRAAASFGHIEVLEAGYTFVDRIFLLSYGLAFYLVKLVLPLQMSAIYAYPEKVGGWLPAEYYLSLLLLLLLAWGVYRLRYFRKETMAALAFMVLSISMVLPLFWSRLFIVAERYVYLPYIALFLLAGLWLNAVISGEIKLSPGIRTWILGLSVAYVLIFALTGFSRLGVWKDTRSLMEDVIDKNRSPSDRAFAWFFLGNVSDRDGDIQQAIKDYSRALDYNPGHIQALNNRGIMYGSLGNFDAGLRDFDAAIRLKPSYAEAWYNRGIVHFQLGQQHAACNDWQQAKQKGFSQADYPIRQHCD
jgi:protein O-mannosyl-transferase